MIRGHSKFFIALVLIFFLLFFVLLISQNYTNLVVQLIKHYKLIGPLFLVLWRIIGIIFPAIPAGVVSFAVVPLFGWFKTYLYTLTGILIGTSASFWLARKFREPLIGNFASLKKIHKIENELSERQEFFIILAFRLFTAPVMDFSSYAAGLTKISFRKFLLATFIASLPDIAIFYFGEQLYKTVFGRSVIVAVSILFFIGIGYFLIKKFVVSQKE